MGVPWMPLEKGDPNPALIAQLGEIGLETKGIQVWQNNLYQVIARDHPGGLTHLSIKRHDRRTIRSWRHLQQIKNEVCGMEREGLELFPAESRLADGSNEYHLWVLPEGQRVPIGFQEGLVTTDEQAERFTEGPGKGRQEPWQPGLTTGRNEHTRYMRDDEERLIQDAVRGSGEG